MQIHNFLTGIKSTVTMITAHEHPRTQRLHTSQAKYNNHTNVNMGGKGRKVSKVKTRKRVHSVLVFYLGCLTIINK